MSSDAPHRVQLRRSRGWRMPANTVRVCRPTRWGNPFRVGIDGDDATCVARYREHLCQRLESDAELRRALREELAGRNLACWCAPERPCHADVLLALANAAGQR